MNKEAIMPEALVDFSSRVIEADGRKHTVLTSGAAGPAIVIIHEIYGVTPTLIRFARWVRDAGFRVYAPVLFGPDDGTAKSRPDLGRILGLCVSREFTLFSDGKTSPIVEWLKAVARVAHGECSGRGVGVIGMCLTGNFALGMAVDPVVLAPVMAQPSLPANKPGGMGLSPGDVETVQRRVREEGLQVRAYRFAGDDLCRAARFEAFERALGPAFTGTVLPDEAGNPKGRKPPHSVFTGDLIDAAGEPTRKAVDEVIGFFRARLS
jgi:dienelactone hydrolase